MVRSSGKDEYVAGHCERVRDAVDTGLDRAAVAHVHSRPTEGRFEAEPIVFGPIELVTIRKLEAMLWIVLIAAGHSIGRRRRALHDQRVALHLAGTLVSPGPCETAGIR